jgi:Kef-type K+ transport system membrane component KefB
MLFPLTVGLDMRPEKVWSMRRLIFGMESAQMLGTAALAAGYCVLAAGAPWKTAVLLG